MLIYYARAGVEPFQLVLEDQREAWDMSVERHLKHRKRLDFSKLPPCPLACTLKQARSPCDCPHSILEDCLRYDPTKRPTAHILQRQVQSFLESDEKAGPQLRAVIGSSSTPGSTSGSARNMSTSHGDSLSQQKRRSQYTSIRLGLGGMLAASLAVSVAVHIRINVGSPP